MKKFAKGFKWLLVTAVLAANLVVGVRLYSQEVAVADATAEKDSPYEMYTLFSKVVEQVRANYVDADKSTYEELIQGALRGMLQSLDPHSQFMDAESFQAALAAPPDSEEAVRLLEDLLTHIFPAYSDLAGGKGLGFLPLDAGLARISQHASQRGRSRRFRANQINASVGGAAAPFEIAVIRADRNSAALRRLAAPAAKTASRL